MKTFTPNTSPLTAKEVETIRGDRSQSDAATSLGVDPSTWRYWEKFGIHGPWAFLLREWADEAIDRQEPCKVYAESVRELVEKFGGKEALADALGVDESTVRGWLRYGGPKTRGGWSCALAIVCELNGVEVGR